MTHIHAAVWLPESCNQCIQLGTVGGMVQEKGSIYSAAAVGLCCTHGAPCTSALSSGFSTLQGNAESLDRWCGKTKPHPIFYFVSNTSSKNYRNRIMYVKIIASRRWDVFLRHGVVVSTFECVGSVLWHMGLTVCELVCQSLDSNWFLIMMCNIYSGAVQFVLWCVCQLARSYFVIR